MNLTEKLKSFGDIQIPLSMVMLVIAITIVMVYQPREIHYVPAPSK